MPKLRARTRWLAIASWGKVRGNLAYTTLKHMSLFFLHNVDMSAKIENKPPLFDLCKVSQNIQPKDEIQRFFRQLLGPKLHVEPKNGYCVNQGDAAISTQTLITGGLSTCTCVILTSDTHNFLSHVDSFTDPKWLADCISRFFEIGGKPTGVFRFNCHGGGLNASAEKNSRLALKLVGLFETCHDKLSVSQMHTVFAKEPGAHDRVSTYLGRLKFD